MSRQTLVLFLALSLGHVLLISAQVQSNSGLPLIESLAFGAFARVQLLTAGMADAARSVWVNYVALHGVVAENDALKRKVLELEGQAQEQRAMVTRLHSLEDALRLQQSVTAKTIAARVIAGDPAPGSLTILIDRGSADGVAPNMAVIATNGVVGRVVGRPDARAAQVQLLVGRQASAGAVLERTGVGGAIEGGAGDPPLRMLFVSNLADVKPGDRVLTSGLDKIFPRGFVIGTVLTAKRAQVHQDIKVVPAVDFSDIGVVLVVLTPPAGGAGG